MAAPRPAGGLALVKMRVAGVAFLAVIAGLVLLTVALYQKTFTPVVRVALKTDRIGNQLSAPADVKLRGLVVGEVRDVSSTGDGATIDLALQPDKVGLIPANVEAQLLPKTLFGEKFVALVVPEQPASTPIKAGAVIPQDRSTTAIETARVLDDLLPLLQSLRPQDLSRTLNAVSGALRDRGDRIGQNFVLVDDYFSKLNPALPTIQKDLQGLADLADTYDAAAPDLLAVLDNLSFTNRSLVDQKQELATFLGTTTTFARSADSLVRDNEQRLVSLATDSLPSLQLFARYSPEYPCLLQGLAAYDPTVSRTFGGLQPGLHITLEVTQDQKGYAPGDEPAYRDSRPAYCQGLPNTGYDQTNTAPDAQFADGYRDGGSAAVRASSAVDPALLLETPEAQTMALAAVAAPVLGVPVDAVPADLADLLFGPAARGTTVALTPGGPQR